MCDSGGKPFEFSPSLPKELIPLFQSLANKTETGMSQGATPYRLPIPGSAPMDPQQVQARNMISAMMGQRYNPTTTRYSYTPGTVKPEYNPFEGGGGVLRPGAGNRTRQFKEWVDRNRQPGKNLP